MNIYNKTNILRSLIHNRCDLCTTLRALSSKDITNKVPDSQFKIPDDYDVHKVTKEDMIWRESFEDQNKQYFYTLRMFYKDSNNVEVAKALQMPLDLSYERVKNWFLRVNKKRDIMDQSFNPERNEVLGNELAAAHFVVFRGGAIKFHGDNIWIKADEYKNYNLPAHYVKDKYIEAIDCSEMKLYYEGLENFRKVKFLKWLSFNDCEYIDDWCLDAICGAHYKSLVYLDLRNCPNITRNGLTAFWKMEKLRILLLDDILRSSEYEMTVLMLQAHLPQLEIRVGDFVEDDYCDPK